MYNRKKWWKEFPHICYLMGYYFKKIMFQNDIWGSCFVVKYIINHLCTRVFELKRLQTIFFPILAPQTILFSKYLKILSGFVHTHFSNFFIECTVGPIELANKCLKTFNKHNLHLYLPDSNFFHDRHSFFIVHAIYFYP